MKSKIRRLLTVLLTLSLVVSSCGFVYATATEFTGPTVTYDKGANTFTFSNFPNQAEDIVVSGGQTQEKYPNLFTGMENMMPGDSVSENIRFVVKNAGKDTVNLILRAEDPEGQPYVDSSSAYRSYYSTSARGTDAAAPRNGDYEKLTGGQNPAVLTVTFPDGQTYNDTLTATAEGALVETKGVYVGKFTGSDKAMDVTVDFELPIEAGNEYQGLTAKLGWVIVAEVIDYVEPYNPPEKPPVNPPAEDPDEPEEPLEDLDDGDVPLSGADEPEEPFEDIDDGDVPLADVPATGDSSTAWLIAALLSAAGLCAVWVTGKKRSETAE